MDLTLIKRIAFEKNMGLTQVAQKCGFTPQNLRRCVRINKIQATDLEKIAKVLDVSIGVFFGEERGANHAPIATPKAPEDPSKIELLKEQLQLKSEVIDLLKYKISILTNQ